MTRLAYKGFEKGLVCMGYQFQMGKNVTAEANCHQNGFHCAEDPLDCFSYYPSLHNSDYCLVLPGGDVDEDDIDSKISCTELTILKKLTEEEFFVHALAYMTDHPGRERNRQVKKDRGEASGGYTVVCGHDPVARGKKGDILALAKEDTTSGRIIQIAVAKVDGKKIKSGVWYDTNFQRRKAG